MYRSERELDDVLAFQAFVGQRRHGHFDHDAHGMTGTGQSRHRAAAQQAPVEAAAGEEPIVITFVVDEKTGALILE